MPHVATGVGDDDEGWGADGQHAILWHKGAHAAGHEVGHDSAEMIYGIREATTNLKFLFERAIAKVASSRSRSEPPPTRRNCWEPLR